jgi:hypothetical protein
MSTKRGRPPVITERWSKVTVVLTDREVARLDRAAIDVRLRQGRAVSRAEILRNLIDATSDAMLFEIATKDDGGAK